MELTKFDNLTIRACKACRSYKETIRRLKKIQGMRSGIASSFIEDGYILYNLLEIIDDYALVGLPEFVSKVKGREDLLRMQKRFGTDVESIDPIMDTCISILRLTKPSEAFPNFHTQAMFRKKS